MAKSRKWWFIMMFLLITGIFIEPEAVSAMVNAANQGTTIYYDNIRNADESSIFYGAKENESASWIFSFYKGLSAYAPYVMVLSIVTGGFIFILSRKNKGLRRFAMFGLCIGIPVLVAFLIFGIGVLCGIFVKA